MASPNTPPTPADDIQSLRFSHSAHKASPIELLRTTDLRARCGEIYCPTRLNFHLIQFVTHGSGKHWVDFKPVELERGDLLHIRPGQVHSFDPGSSHEAVLLLFLPEAVQDLHLLLPLNFRTNGTIRPHSADFDLLLEILTLHESRQSSQGVVNLDRLAPYCLSAIVAAISDILEKSESVQCRSTSPVSEQLVYKFNSLLPENHASHRDLQWYVSTMNVTARTLARACHSVASPSPKKWIGARITLEAKRLLILSADTMEQIAFSLGFSESTNFVKFFKRIAGQTPEAFRSSQLP